MTSFSFCTSGLQAFVGMSALQGETRCEALEGLRIIANVFWSASYLNGSKCIYLRPKKKRELSHITVTQRPGAPRAGCHCVDLRLLAINQLREIKNPP